MIEDREIWACANLLLRQHGSEAWNIASRRAQELLAQGEAEGHRTFARIMDRIRELEAVSPVSRVH
jgi:hypothetical protein